jgi:hypothetical protein
MNKYGVEEEQTKHGQLREEDPSPIEKVLQKKKGEELDKAHAEKKQAQKSE